MFQRIRKRHALPLGIVASGILVVLFLAFCQKRQRPENFILITLDTQRADFISASSPKNAQTPHIDFLSGQGILFNNCYSPIPITLPAHASIFFSESPHKIKNYNNGQEIIKKRSRPSFVNLFKKKEYATAAFVSLGVLESRFGLEEAFDTYEDQFPKDRWYLTAGEVNQKLFPWLEANRDRKFFLWVHYSDPHDPYAPPDSANDFKLYLNDSFIGETCLNKYATHQVVLDLKSGKNALRFEIANEAVTNSEQFKARLDKLEFLSLPDQKPVRADHIWGWYIRRDDNVFFFRNGATLEIDNRANLSQVKLTYRGKLLLPPEAARENYKKEVEYMDGEIGRLWDKLKALALFEKTAILLAGDHGEGLGEYHNNFGDPHFGHIHFLYDIYMKVPLIIYDPSSSQKGVRRDQMVTLLDIAPTISKIMGLETLANFQGRDLLHLKKGEKLTIQEETHRPESVRDRFALLSYPWHLIFTPEENKYELFNLKEGEAEGRNLYAEKASETEIAALKKKTDDFARDVLKEKEEIRIDSKTEEMLRALGYIK